MSIFSMDNPFFRFVGKVVDLVWLNILTLICCIPLFTAGAAISAMYRVLLRMALKEDSVITKPYFKAFKENFKNTTLLWVPSCIVLLMLTSSAYLVAQGVMASYGKLYIAVMISILIIAGIIFSLLNYALPLFARYDSDFKQTVKNAALMIIAYFPRTLCMLVIWMFPFALMTLSFYFFFFWFLYGLSIPGYFNAMLLSQIFIKTEQSTEDELEEI